MEYNNTKKLPVGVGQKIVEALKKQPKAYDDDSVNINEFKSFAENNQFEQNYSTPKNEERWNKSSDFQQYEEVSTEETGYRYDKDEDYEGINDNYGSSREEEYAITEKYNKLKNKRQEYENYQFLDDDNNYEEKSFRGYSEKKQRPQVDSTDNAKKEFSSNIETLTRLIHQLPSGVTRQTGAQIIRQTMEAIGMSMNKVLGEAQQAQEGHAQKIKEHLNSIEEYKNNIRILEKELQKNKKRVDDLDDIISLFVLTERDKKK